MSPERQEALVIGAGPAGLMAAEAMARTGLRVTVAEAMPSPARKLLMAGKSGLNLTNAAPFADVLDAYGDAAPWLTPMLRAFGPAEIQDWARGLDQALFTGSTGRVFPRAMKASPLLRAWLARLNGLGVGLRTRWRWRGWDGAAVLIDTPDGSRRLHPGATVLACGGASWARLGADGAWVAHLPASALAPFAPANAGLRVVWPARMARHFGAPLKGIALRAAGCVSRGEVMISARGLEGGGLYPLSPALRAGAALTIDLAPDLDAAAIRARLAAQPRKQSRGNRLRRALRLAPAKQALLAACGGPPTADDAGLAQRIKALAVPHDGLRPLDEAISTAGGLRFAALDAGLMLRARPGTFAAGEMLDWEAPTGGYLLTGCLATGHWAGRAASAFARG